VSIAGKAAPVQHLTSDMVLVHKVFRRELRLLAQLISGVQLGDSHRASALAAHYRELATALRRGRVRLAAYPSAAATLVPRAIAGLRARHPDVDVELAEAEPPEALALLATGDADLALVFAYDGHAPAEGPGRVGVWG